jgi:hypothetical protein
MSGTGPDLRPVKHGEGADPVPSSQPEHPMNTNASSMIKTRATCLLASATLTALLVGSQLGLAQSYTRQADAVMAAKRTQPVAQQTSPTVPRLRG